MKKSSVLKPGNLLIILLILSLTLVIFFGIKKDRQERNKIQAVITQDTTKGQNVESGNAASLNIYEKLKGKQDVSILILGDSIGRGEGVDDSAQWYAQAKNLIEKEFSVKVGIEIGDINSNTVFSGFYDYINNFTNKKYDLVVLCFGEKDITLLKIENYQQIYEALIRKIKSNNSGADIVSLIESSIQINKTYPVVIQDLAERYGILPLDMRESFKNSNVPYNNLTSNSIMPNKDGYAIYASTFLDAVKKAVNDNRKINTAQQDYLYKDAKNFEDSKAASAIIKNDGFSQIGYTYSSIAPGNNISINVSGNLFGFVTSCGNNGGTLGVYINDKLSQQIDCYSASDILKPVLITLDPSNKGNVIKIQNENIKNASSTGNKISINSILSN